MEIFHYLTIKDITRASCVCHQWATLLEERSIWIPFSKTLTQSHEYDDITVTKSTVIEKVKALRAETIKRFNRPRERFNRPRAVYLHLLLTQLGLSSLDEAKKCADKLNNKGGKNDSVLYDLAFGYLNYNQRSEAQEIMKRISRSTMFGQFAWQLFENKCNSSDMPPSSGHPNEAT